MHTRIVRNVTSNLTSRGTDVHDRSFARFILPWFFSRLIVQRDISCVSCPAFSLLWRKVNDIRLL